MGSGRDSQGAREDVEAGLEAGDQARRQDAVVAVLDALEAGALLAGIGAPDQRRPHVRAEGLSRQDARAAQIEGVCEGGDETELIQDVREIRDLLA